MPPTAVEFPDKLSEKPQHCPLCNPALMYPENDIREPAFIFLDMDGVMYPERDVDRYTTQKIDVIKSRLFEEKFKQGIPLTDYECTILKGHRLAEPALRQLHDLMERIEQSGKRPLVILTSDWRNRATLNQFVNQVFVIHKFAKILCGKTAPLDYQEKRTPEGKQGYRFAKDAKTKYQLDLENRETVISFWLRDHGFDPETANFLVLDDEHDYYLKKFGERFVCVNYPFLTERQVKRAMEVLTK